MNAFAIHHQAIPAQLQLDSLAVNKNVSDAQKINEVSRQFEAVLMRQILSDIRKPILDKSQGDPTANGIYNDMINNQMAQSIEQGGGLGLASSLSTQLSHQVLGQMKAGATTRQPAFHPVSVRKSAVLNP